MTDQEPIIGRSFKKKPENSNGSRVYEVQQSVQRADKVEDEDSDDEEISKMTHKQKVIEQNIKLKEQIFLLSQELEQIIEKDRERKKKLEPINSKDDEEALKEKKMELKKQQLEVVEMKNKIYIVKRQLENVYNNRNMINKEEQLRNLKAELRQLEDEKQGLLKIKTQQSKNIKNINNQEEYLEKIEQLKKELSRVKEQARQINEKVIESERILRKNHEQYITKQERIKELEQKLASNKEKSRNRKPIQTVTKQMVATLQEEISLLEQERREEQKSWQQKIRAIDTEFEQKKMEEEKKLLILKEKEKECRINELKIKQLRKLVRHNLTTQAVMRNEVDMSQYRHRRNIKYLDK